MRIWNLIPRLIFQEVSGLEFLLKCPFDIGKIPIKLSIFHRQLPQIWNLIYNFSPHTYTIWNNRNITYKSKSIFSQNLFSQDIIFVKQFINDIGELFSYGDFITKYDVPFTQQEFQTIIEAIPLGMINLSRNYDDTPSLSTLDFTATLKLEGMGFLNPKCNNKYL